MHAMKVAVKRQRNRTFIQSGGQADKHTALIILMAKSPGSRRMWVEGWLAVWWPLPGVFHPLRPRSPRSVNTDAVCLHARRLPRKLRVRGCRLLRRQRVHGHRLHHTLDQSSQRSYWELPPARVLFRELARPLSSCVGRTRYPGLLGRGWHVTEPSWRALPPRRSSGARRGVEVQESSSNKRRREQRDLPRRGWPATLLPRSLTEDRRARGGGCAL